jgi:hypothetical protein
VVGLRRSSSVIGSARHLEEERVDLAEPGVDEEALTPVMNRVCRTIAGVGRQVGRVQLSEEFDDGARLNEVFVKVDGLEMKCWDQTAGIKL